MRPNTLFVAALGAALALAPAIPDAWSSWALGATLIAGLPHGAADHRIARSLTGGPLLFHLLYLATAALVFVAWWLVPVAAMLLFLGVSAWHFGESDLLRVPGATVAKATRGLVLVLAPLLAHPERSAELLTWTAGVPAAANLIPTSGGPVAAALIVLTHLASLIDLARERRWDRRTLRDELAAAAALGLLAVSGGPLLGLALYFVLWHTPSHFSLLERTLPAILPAVLPRFAVAAVGVAALALALDPARWPVAVVLVTSALTVPHALVVHFTFGQEST